MLCSSRVRIMLVTGSLLSLNAVADEVKSNSPNAGMRYAGINIQRDNDDNRQITGALSLTIGNHSWIQAAAGTLHVQQQHDALNPTLMTLGTGITSHQWTASLIATQRKDGDKYHQQDWNGTLDWHNDKGGIGIDALHRNTELHGMVPVTNQGSTTYVPASQTLEGNGIGLHAHINLNERLTLSLGGMHYNYSSTFHQAGGNTSGSNGGSLNTVPNNILGHQSLVTNPLQDSGVTREAAILQSNWNASITYRLSHVALIAQYFNDKGIDNTSALNTIQLSAAIFVDEHWTLAPGVGYSTREQSGGVASGLFTARYGW